MEKYHKVCSACENIRRRRKEMDKKTAGYLEAARIIAEGEEGYSCNAVGVAFQVGPRDIDQARIEVVEYLDVFWPGRSSQRVSERQEDFLEAIEDESLITSDWNSPASDNLRVLMLCLMAACWRDFK